MRRIRLAASAQADLAHILAWTQTQFGGAARERYQQLITAALRDVAQDPLRPGSRLRPELGDGVRTWHLRLSRQATGAAPGRVGRPRHFLVYRDAPPLLLVGRVLHDAMDPEQPLGPDTPWD